MGKPDYIHLHSTLHLRENLSQVRETYMYLCFIIESAYRFLHDKTRLTLCLLAGYLILAKHI
jgi:hypothetical protein